MSDESWKERWWKSSRCHKKGSLGSAQRSDRQWVRSRDLGETDSSADKAALARCLSFSLLGPELFNLNRQRFYCLMSASLVHGHWLPSSLLSTLYAMVRQNTALEWRQWSKAPFVMEDRKQKEETRDKISPSWESALWPSLSIRVSPPKVSTTSW